MNFFHTTNLGISSKTAKFSITKCGVTASFSAETTRNDASIAKKSHQRRLPSESFCNFVGDAAGTSCRTMLAEQK
jgi:hypothetical protein